MGAEGGYFGFDETALSQGAHWKPSHFTVAFTCPHATPGPVDPSCDLLGMESEITIVPAESGFLLTSSSLWGGRGELGRDFRDSLGMNCSHHLCQTKRWNWEAAPLCKGSWLWLPREGTKPGTWLDLAGDASAVGEHVDCPVPAGNTSPLPSPCRQERPEALGAAGEKAHCFPPELGGGGTCLTVGLHPTRTGTICSGAMLPVPAAPDALPHLRCAACSSSAPSRAHKPGTLKT